MSEPGYEPIGIAEVAALAGVSPATVSRALRGIPGVSVATRHTVQRVAAELGYVASSSASALAGGKTSAIGVLAPWISRWFFTAVVDGAQEALQEQGYDLLLYPLGANAGPEAKYVDTRSIHKKVDGILGLNVPQRLQPSSLANLRVPMVTVGSSIPGLPGVLVEDVQVGYLATRHLIALGHRKIAFVGTDPDGMYGFTVAADRHRGYCRALREAGLCPDPALTEVTGFAVEAGEAAFVHQLLVAGGDRADVPTGIVAVSDEVAMGVLYAARKHGFRVPADLSVIGVDDHDLAYLFDLTTIAQPVRHQGGLAVKMLLDQIRTGELPDPLLIQLEPGLIERQTTGPARGW